MASPRICSVENCGKPLSGHGFCEMHRKRWRKHGDPALRSKPANGEVERWINEVALAYDGDECLRWPFSVDRKGYGMVVVNGQHQIASRVVCERAHGAPPTTLHQAAHSCGNGHEGCVNKRHLSWKTRAENEADKIIHGTSNRGERCGAAKLTEPQVREIRRLAGGMSHGRIAKQFGVARQTISKVISGDRWGWL
jgi:hypothetical protein